MSENFTKPAVLSRRDLLKSSALAGVALSIGAATLGSSDALAQNSQSNVWQVPDFDLAEMTVADLQAALTAGKLTSRALCEKYLSRIAAIDKSGPAINSIIELNPDALRIADELDAERKASGTRGPLHGIPILIKDNIDTADRMMTTAGSMALIGPPAPRDAHIVERLRKAGAILLGKTNLSEWANFRSTKSVSGWSGRGGQSRNPYALDRNTSGSSSGAGSSMAAALAAIAVGTETDGSIVSPASSNGVVGIKPTVGLVSRSGIVPISHSQDTAGPMARTVADAAALLTAMAGSDPADQDTREADRRREDYTLALKPGALSGARLGVVRAKQFGLGTKLDTIYDASLAALKQQGAILVDPVEIKHLGEYDDAEFEVLLFEFKDNLNKYLTARGSTSSVKSLAEVIKFNETNRDQELPYFGQEILLQAEEKGPLTDKKYREALEKSRKLARAGIDGALKEHKLDALVSLSNGPAWLIDLVNGDSYSGGNSSVSAVAGYPHITVPAGFLFGMPIGLSIFGAAWSEAKLISLAHGFEQATKARRAPRFLKTADLTKR